MDEWTATTWRGTAFELHHLDVPPVPQPAIWIHLVTGAALVLGSTQADALIDRDGAAAAGIEVCRRRTGGGLVYLTAEDCWIDLLLPATSRLWDADVGRAFGWLGQTWAATLEELLPAVSRPLIAVHRGPLTGGEPGRLICFAGLGPGEVTVGGRKVVGLSQRRWRGGVRFQSLLIRRWLPDPIDRYLDPEQLRRTGIDLDALPIGLGDETPLPDVEEIARCFRRHLPSPSPMVPGRRCRPGTIEASPG